LLRNEEADSEFLLMFDKQSSNRGNSILKIYIYESLIITLQIKTWRRFVRQFSVYDIFWFHEQKSSWFFLILYIFLLNKAASLLFFQKNTASYSTQNMTYRFLLNKLLRIYRNQLILIFFSYFTIIFLILNCASLDILMLLKHSILFNRRLWSFFA